MKDKDLLLAALLAFAAWYLYTRSRGLTLAGDYANPMLPPGSPWLVPDPMTSVQPSGATGAGATNVLSAIGNLFQSIVQRTAGPGNTPNVPAASVLYPGAPNTGVYPGDMVPPFDPSLQDASPYWMWDLSWERPVNTGIPVLDWTLSPDANYIPPPPGT